MRSKLRSQIFEQCDDDCTRLPASTLDAEDSNVQGEERDLATMRADLFAQALRSETATSFTGGTSHPWLPDNAHPWSWRRTQVAKLMLSKYTEYSLTALILFNVGLIIVETDQEAKCQPKFKSDMGSCPTSHENILWLKIANLVLLVIYTLEAALSIYALRRIYFGSPSCMFEFLLCVGSWLPYWGVDVGKISWLRIFRCFRLLQAARFVERVPELNTLIQGFRGSMRAMFFGMLMILALLCFFSILTVQFVHPKNVELHYDGCPRCSRGFESVSASMLTLYQQIVTGDSWGLISIPVVESSYAGILLPLIQIVIGLGAMNLVLGAVIDQAMAARESNRIAQAARSAEAHKQRKLQLLDTVREMDDDLSGDINLAEIHHALQTNVDLRTRLALVGLRTDEVGEIVDALTHHGTDSISYGSFCNVFDDIDAADVRKNVVLTKLLLSSMHRDIITRLDLQSKELKMISSQVAELNAVPCSQSHADSDKQGRMASSPPWRPPFEHDCPRSASTYDVDFRLSITEAFVVCETEMDSEKKRLQQSFIQLDTKWDACLRALEGTLLSCADSCESHGPDTRFLDHAKRSHQTLKQQRQKWCTDLMSALEDGFSFWEMSPSASDTVRAEYECDSYKQLTKYPRFPRAPWSQSGRDFVPQTPQTGQQHSTPRLPTNSAADPANVACTD